jgi:hypothetical protein
MPSSQPAKGPTAAQDNKASMASQSTAAHQALSTGPRIAAQDLRGEWRVFDMTAVPIDERDALTGQVRKTNVYFSQQTRQNWQQPKDMEPGQDGGALWLPGSTMLELRMLPTVSRGQSADEDEGMDMAGTGRGFLISFAWLVRQGMLISMQREYDAAGELLEVRSRSAVKGQWVGGSM